MTQMNKTPKKFGINLACNMAADCIRDNYAPTSVILSNLIALQKAEVFPKELQKEFFKRPTPVAPSDLQNVRAIMDAMRSPNNGITQLLIDKMSANWAFKKAPPVDLTKPQKTFVKPNQKKLFVKNKQTVTPTVVVKKTTNS
jgi:hypothetical protein